MMMRCSASAASTALMDFSRETESGRMMKGKTTTSLRGRTGRMSGIGRSASRSAEATSFSSSSATGLLLVLRGHGYLDLLLAQIRHPRQDDLEDSVLHARLRVMGVDGPGKRHRLDEPSEVSLHAEEAH